MADDHKVKVEQDANSIADWLTKHRAEFERDGIEEAALASSVGLTEDEAREAVDYLENHEEVVRWPQALMAPPQFLLKPGRGWPDRLSRAAAEGHSS